MYMFKDFIKSLAVNFITSFTGSKILWHVLAISITAIIVLFGFDWQYFLAVRGELLNKIFFPAVIIGMFLPVLLMLGLVIYGSVKKNKIISIYGWAITQAAIIGWTVSVVYKSLTGRVQPNLLNITMDQSRNWNFGFWEHGIFWGWPSSHTTVAFATVTTLVMLLNKKKPTLKWFSILYAFYIGIGISFSTHWFSEFVAGAIIGTVVGFTVGNWWKNRFFLYLK